MSNYDMDIENSMEAQEELELESKPAARVKTRRRLEDYLHLRKLRDEFDYFMTGDATYTEADLDDYGLGEAVE